MRNGNWLFIIFVSFSSCNKKSPSDRDGEQKVTSDGRAYAKALKLKYAPEDHHSVKVVTVTKNDKQIELRKRDSGQLEDKSSTSYEYDALDRQVRAAASRETFGATPSKKITTTETKYLDQEPLFGAQEETVREDGVITEQTSYTFDLAAGRSVHRSIEKGKSRETVMDFRDRLHPIQEVVTIDGKLSEKELYDEGTNTYRIIAYTDGTEASAREVVKASYGDARLLRAGISYSNATITESCVPEGDAFLCKRDKRDHDGKGHEHEENRIVLQPVVFGLDGKKQTTYLQHRTSWTIKYFKDGKLDHVSEYKYEVDPVTFMTRKKWYSYKTFDKETGKVNFESTSETITTFDFDGTRPTRKVEVERDTGQDGVTTESKKWDPLESTCRHASLSIL